LSDERAEGWPAYKVTTLYDPTRSLASKCDFDERGNVGAM
jgi:hypothetical protein